MKQVWLILWLLPIAAIAQEVKPVLSADYIALINQDTINGNRNRLKDSTNSFRYAGLHFDDYNFSVGFTVKKISIGADNTIKLHPLVTQYLFISGTASATVELQRINRLPAVQNEYVQGRSVNGTLQWKGPETNELFSYGPSIHTLEYDGTNYPYDVNGQLVPTGFGNGQKAIAYNNSIFRNGALFSHAISVQAKYKKNYQQVVSTTIKAGQSREHSFITANKNKADHFSVAAEANIKRFTISSSYNYQQEYFSNNNRNGFFNRVYQDALLSPVSFDNHQGNMIGNSPGSYSTSADNPFFLLANDDHGFWQQQQTGNLVLEQKFPQGKIRLSPSFEKLQQHSNEGYQQGTAFFPNGIVVNRNTSDANYFLQANGDYTINNIGDHGRLTITTNYIFANTKSSIAYLPAHSVYNYQRSSHDLSVGFFPQYRHDNIDAGLNLVNKIYTSNTSLQNNFFLPSISAFTHLDDVFGLNFFSAKLTGGFSRFNSELPINRSFPANSLVQYPVANALQYLPLTEVNSFDNLSPIEHREYNAGMELNYKNKIALSANCFTRLTSNDIFPLMNGGQLQLINMASHRNQGMELELNLYPYLWDQKKLSVANMISFVTYRSKVTAVKAGYNFSPIAGFSDVHKAIVQGEPLGAIVGNSFLKDAAGNIIIGTDGFPLVNNTPSVIGNPVPDFTMKMTNHFSWKHWDFIIDWEWKKGGDIWNGTEALLDYYGRSAGSAALRNTTNYIFTGVNTNGTHNTIPVSFYDPAWPVQQNRWVRYGPGGIAEAYIQKGDCLRLNNAGISYITRIKKYLQQLQFTLYANNIMLWSAYKGADPNQLLKDQPGTSGLDFFNLPSYQSFGFTVSLQF